MNDFLERQRTILLQSIGDYRLGQISLDALIKRIEGVTGAVDSPTWRDSVYPIVLSIEQVNAVVIDSKASLTPSNVAIVDSALNDLQALLSAPNVFES